MKKKSRILAILIAVMMLTALMPMSVSAVGIQEGVGTITERVTIVSFAGHEWVVVGDIDNTKFGGTNKSITLLLKNGDVGGGFGVSKFGETNNIYDGSILHTKMKNIYGGFDTKEQTLVEARTLNQIADTTGSMDGTLDNQYVWPLSFIEYSAIADIKPLVTAYGQDNWLRSPNITRADQVEFASTDGYSATGYDVTVEYAVRPALNLDLSNVLFTSDVAGGKSMVAGSDLSAAAVPTNAIKFTVKDSSLKLSSAIETAKSGSDITFNYTTSGSPNRLSAIVQAADGKVKYYGNLKNNPGASGTAKVTVPTGLTSTDKLLVFAEQVNGDNFTDFASTPIEIADKVKDSPKKIGEPAMLYSVKLNAGKGFMYKNSKSKKTVKSKTISVEHNAKYGKLPTAHRKGYYFKGWYTKKSGGTKVTASSIMKSNKNTTLYAQYKPNGKITKCHVVKVKKSPYDKAKTIGHMKYGKTVQVIGKVGVGKNKFWYKVKYGKKTGYIYSKYVKSNKSGTKTIKIQ